MAYDPEVGDVRGQFGKKVLTIVAEELVAHRAAVPWRAREENPELLVITITMIDVGRQFIVRKTDQSTEDLRRYIRSQIALIVENPLAT
jgi:hypothetical protein